MFETIGEIILKVTRDCNLRCKYCYVKDKDKYKDEKLTLDNYKKLIDQIVIDRNRSIRKIPAQDLQIIFHGGEPTLLGQELLEQFIQYARLHLPKVTFGIQTNLTNLDNSWLDFFAKHKIIPGISIDGFSFRDNLLRNKKVKFLNKIKLFKIKKINYGPLFIVSRQNVKSFKKNLANLLKITGLKQLKANYVENTYSPDFSYPEVSAKEFYDNVFLPVMQKFFKGSGIQEENIRNIVDKFINNLFFHRQKNQKNACYQNCLVKFCAGGNNVVEVDPEGNVCFCGRWSDANEVNTLGNYLKPKDFFGLNSLNKVLQVHLLKIKDIKAKGCDFCYAQDICSYGCVAFAHDKYNGQIKIREDLVCTYSKKVKEYLIKNKYHLIYNYAKFYGWEIKQDENYFYYKLAKPVLFSDYKQLNDADMELIKSPAGDFFVKISKGLISTRIKN